MYAARMGCGAKLICGREIDMRATKCVLAIALVGGLLAVGAAHGDEQGFVVKPPVVTEMSPADRQARDAVVKLIAEKQKKLPTEWALTVPERASGLPAKYDLLLHRGSGCFMDTDARLEIQVRDQQAKWELTDKTGIFRVTRPAAEIDSLVRQLAYAFHAVEKPRERYGFSSITIGPAPLYVEVVSRDDKFPFHLHPAHLQAEESGDEPLEKIRSYAFAQLADFAFPVAEKQGQAIAAAEQSAEILRRLKEIPLIAEFREQTELRKNPFETPEQQVAEAKMAAGRSPEAVRQVTSAHRHQLWVERHLYGKLAVKVGLAEAMPELKRLELADETRMLEIATSADLQVAIKRAIAYRSTENQMISQWAVTFTLDKQHPERLIWLIEVLPDLIKPETQERADRICFVLARTKLTKEHVDLLTQQYRDTKHPFLKISLAHTLLRHTHDASYFDFLAQQVRTLKPEKETYPKGPRTTAADYLFRYAADTGKFRKEAYELLQVILAESRQTETPDSFHMFELVKLLGKLGSEKDVKYLTGLSESKSVYLASEAIKALDEISPPVALQQLHRRMEELIKQPGTKEQFTHDYSHLVYGNFSVIIFNRDVAAVPLLKRAWERLNAKEKPKPVTKPATGDEWLDLGSTPEQPDNVSAGYEPQHLIAFLEAKNGVARAEAAIAHFGDRASLEDKPRMQKLVKQLIAEGADPKRCEELLRDPYEEERE
ncbi:hypothetical protein [Anatilimnocola floriformis]|uniref:hypothetical protein n=1 Tax=Anatilimnocola floriformis TaxID=2948575 RepID=UPI0020C2358D|nr:hypothetical protein [Anatilimnocola floriformis]